jgi:hypothetical protein
MTSATVLSHVATLPLPLVQHSPLSLCEKVQVCLQKYKKTKRVNPLHNVKTTGFFWLACYTLDEYCVWPVGQANFLHPPKISSAVQLCRSSTNLSLYVHFVQIQFVLICKYLHPFR